MRRRAAVLLVLLLVLLPVLTARAQESPPAETNPAPAPVQTPAPAPAPAPPEAPAAPAPPPPPAWLPRAAAALTLLDKINAVPRTVTVKVGQSMTFGALTIAVKACDVRPPDRAQDATAFLDIADSHAGMPGFRGWIFQNEPAADMFQDPVYDVRLAGCAG